ncbi:heat-shock protein [Nodularia spumigena]|uniref:heat-shock protein n=1 Tax=Nodularia spumigena TaxID=70799 RepID=UPI00232C3998|nr:heat-shock protein [Nodularia spumigena]MDB9316775.1 heat-shock protein [Nodularia spumigena CS-590/01A]MDB9325125.1 heat-shock protein [Nodularia spumigena CS-590/02]MDB9334742.1 heat-shock protein [Nodularia spumigena CS-590/01]MDB9342989.1 heat-shock protein [Nodularia spumigena CS-588/06]MDB9369678.1 heat-shock protein [Nodularia spumigena CS-586/05]
MSNNFKTVREVIRWRNFTYNSEIYDLSHLNAHWIEYIDYRDENNPIPYKFIVTYGLHCFTKESKELTSEELELLMYSAPIESREFNFERYYLSKELPSIIRSLGEKTTLVYLAKNGKFATVKVLDSNGIEVDYFVFFKAFRESKRLRLHITTAYPLEKDIGKREKVNFFIIAKNLLNNKKLPSL